MRNNRFILLWIGMIFSSCLFADANQALLSLAKQQGFFFFYRSDCPHCQHFSPVLNRIRHRYGFGVVAISLDGGALPDFEDALMNQGHAQMFQVNTLPSLFLVNPNTHQAVLVSEGDIGEEALIDRLLTLIQMQQTKRVA